MKTFTLAVPGFHGSQIGQLRRALQMVADFVVLPQHECWHSARATTLVQTAEATPFGAVVFVQGLLRTFCRCDLVASVGRNSIEIVAKLGGRGTGDATLRVTLPYQVDLEIGNPMRSEIEAVLTCDETYLGWAGPKATEAKLLHAFRRVEGGEMVGETKYLEGFVNG